MKNISLILLSYLIVFTCNACKSEPEQPQQSQDIQQVEPEGIMEVKASHILVPTKEEADDLVKKLAAGESFADLAKTHSKCPSGRDGGTLGFFGKGQMVPEFEKAAFETEVGKVSEPVQTQFGWHLIYVEDKR